MLAQQNAAKTSEKSHFLYPGMIHVGELPGEILTILGSCVSVCLWDRALKFGGMNHFVLPFWNGDGLKTPKYGNIAIPALLDKMYRLGSIKPNIIAKVFGGGSVLEAGGLLSVGERNIYYADCALEEAKIPIAGRDTGGVYGRKLLFRTGSGEVFIKKLVKSD